MMDEECRRENTNKKGPVELPTDPIAHDGQENLESLLGGKSRLMAGLIMGRHN